MCLNYIYKRIFLGTNFKNAIFLKVNNFKQAIKQKEWWDAFLKFKQSKH